MLVTAMTNLWNNQRGGGVVNIKLAHVSSTDSLTHFVCEKFAERVKEKLGDKVEIKVYPNAALGSEAEMVESLQMGSLDAGTFGRHSAIDSRLDVLNLPFLFENDEHAKKVLRGEEGLKIRQSLNEIMKSKNIIVLGWYETGFREITSNKKIESLDDMKGLLIRTPSTETLVKSFQTWGASPTAIDLSELYTALQSGVVDAQENPFQLIYTNKLYEVQKYLCITNHLMIPNQLVFSKKVWDSYPEDVKAALVEAGNYACNEAGEYNRTTNEALKKKIEEKMTITHMNENSLSKMKVMAFENVWKQFVVDDQTKEIVAEIQSLK